MKRQTIVIAIIAALMIQGCMKDVVGTYSGTGYGNRKLVATVDKDRKMIYQDATPFQEHVIEIVQFDQNFRAQTALNRFKIENGQLIRTDTSGGHQVILTKQTDF